jgi:hypothetical protein
MSGALDAVSHRLEIIRDDLDDQSAVVNDQQSWRAHAPSGSDRYSI